jgi:hypothetical protein
MIDRIQRGADRNITRFGLLPAGDIDAELATVGAGRAEEITS